MICVIFALCICLFVRGGTLCAGLVWPTCHTQPPAGSTASALISRLIIARSRTSILVSSKMGFFVMVILTMTQVLSWPSLPWSFQVGSSAASLSFPRHLKIICTLVEIFLKNTNTSILRHQKIIYIKMRGGLQLIAELNCFRFGYTNLRNTALGNLQGCQRKWRCIWPSW